MPTDCCTTALNSGGPGQQCPPPSPGSILGSRLAAHLDAIVQLEDAVTELTASLNDVCSEKGITNHEFEAQPEAPGTSPVSVFLGDLTRRLEVLRARITILAGAVEV